MNLQEFDEAKFTTTIGLNDFVSMFAAKKSQCGSFHIIVRDGITFLLGFNFKYNDSDADSYTLYSQSIEKDVFVPIFALDFPCKKCEGGLLHAVSYMSSANKTNRAKKLEIENSDTLNIFFKLSKNNETF